MSELKASELPSELRVVKWTHRQDLYLEHQVRRGEMLLATGIAPDAAEALVEAHNAEVGRLVEFVGVLKEERDKFSAMTLEMGERIVREVEQKETKGAKE